MAYGARREAAAEAERAKALQILETVPKLRDLKSIEIEFDHDETGDPIMWIWLTMPPERHPTQQQIDELGAYQDEAFRRLIDADLEHWPHFRIREVA
jgi:hypothetical protein